MYKYKGVKCLYIGNFQLPSTGRRDFALERIVGILGGMGPEATLDFFNKIIKLTDANSDQEHIRIIIENNTSIPDRTRYILNNGENPLKYLIKSAIRLELMGADLIAMPCNTAHYFYDDISKYVDIKFVNMIDEVAKVVSASFGKSPVGLLSTKGTYGTNIYEKYCHGYGVNIVRPSWENQDNLLKLIYNIKNGKKILDMDLIEGILNEFRIQGIEGLILGCTELPLVFNNLDSDLARDFTFIDSTAILAQEVVKLAKHT